MSNEVNPVFAGLMRGLMSPRIWETPPIEYGKVTDEEKEEA